MKKEKNNWDTNNVEYYIWYRIKSRCNNPKDEKFINYGERGIRMCERWLNSHKNFIADMGYRPSLKHSIERIDVNGNYEPNNCKWATYKEQANNTTRNVFIFFEGKSFTLKQFSEKLGIGYKNFHKLYRKNNVPLTQIIEKYTKHQ
jgi:hypothetical protein